MSASEMPAPDYGKLWLMAAVVAGASLGAVLGYLGGFRLVRAACETPDAGNLCGFIPSFFAPAFVVVGAGVGAFAAMLGVIFLMSRRSA
jgi:hypothetical protein